MINIKTEIINSRDENCIEKSSQLLKSGKLVAIPTETVYGLAADAFSSTAVGKIFAAKGRPQDNPLIVHIGNISDVDRLSEDVPEVFYNLADKFWPGPLTMIVKKLDAVPEETSGGLDTVGIRMPNSEIVLDIINSSGVLLAAPSANISGKPSPTSAKHVLDDMNGKIPLIVDGGSCGFGVESTVISLVDRPTLLRPGAVTPDMLREFIPDLEIHPAVLAQLEDREKATSPGMKYKHYAPAGKLTLLSGEDEKFYRYVNSDENNLCICFDEDDEFITCKKILIGSGKDYKDYAKNVFSALRTADEQKAEIIYARCPKKEGIGLAVYNRLIRAAAHRVEEL